MSSRRSIMTLFSSPTDPASHRTRIVLCEKGIEIEIVSVTPGRFPEDLLDLNPDHTLPTHHQRGRAGGAQGLIVSQALRVALDETFLERDGLPRHPASRRQAPTTGF